MKKLILFFALAAISLTSCQKEEPTPNPTPTPFATASSYKFYEDHTTIPPSTYATVVLHSTTTLQPVDSVVIGYYDDIVDGIIYLFDDSTYNVKVKNSTTGVKFCEFTLKCSGGVPVDGTPIASQGSVSVSVNGVNGQREFKVSP
jgi:hypothetical protein